MALASITRIQPYNQVERLETGNSGKILSHEPKILEKSSPACAICYDFWLFYEQFRPIMAQQTDSLQPP